MILCPECSIVWPADRYTEPFKQCFKCRIQGVGFSFGTGGREGKKLFHAMTDKEQQDRTIREAKANGLDPIPAWTKTHYAAPTAAFEAKTAAATATKAFVTKSVV